MAGKTSMVIFFTREWDDKNSAIFCAFSCHIEETHNVHILCNFDRNFFLNVMIVRQALTNKSREETTTLNSSFQSSKEIKDSKRILK